MKSSGIGGQAVIEGIMMKNNDKYSVAVRKPDKEIEVIEKEFVSTTKKYPILNVPIVRGVVNFVDSLRIGMSTLTYSSSFYEEEEEPAKKDKNPKKNSSKKSSNSSKKESKKDSKEESKEESKDKFEALIIGVTVILSVILAIALFMLLPYGVSRLFGKVVKSVMWQNVIEGVVRLLVFLIYVVLIAQMEDIKRVFMYHGAEHKAINCIEHGLELNVENVKKSSRYHKRCGTSFMLFIMIISIIVFMFIDFENRLINMGMRVILVPIIAGISYEILKLAGNSEGFIINLISKPGMWLQGLTTKEPDEDMIEVAIVAIEKVFDWKAYLEENAKEEERVVEFVDMEEIDKINSIEDINDIFENNDDLEAMEKEVEIKKTQPKKSSKNRRSRNKAKAKAKKNSETASNEEAVTQEVETETVQKEISAEEAMISGAVVATVIEEPVEETTEIEPVAEEATEEEAVEETTETVPVAEEATEPEEVVEETLVEEPVTESGEESIEDTDLPILRNNEKFWEEELQIAQSLKAMLESELEESSIVEEAENESYDDFVPDYVLEEPIVEDLIFDDEEENTLVVEEAVEEEAVAEEIMDNRPENPIATEISDEIEIQEYVTLDLPKRKSFSTRTYTKRERKRW